MLLGITLQHPSVLDSIKSQSHSARENQKLYKYVFLIQKIIEESKTDGKYLMIQFIHRVRIGKSKLRGLKIRLVANWRPGH